MKLNFAGQKASELPTLKQLLYPPYIQPGDPERPVVTFIYDGYVYAAVTNVGSNINLHVHEGEHACMNLKSQSLRAIPLNRRVEPVEVAAHVEHGVTHRYRHVPGY